MIYAGTSLLRHAVPPGFPAITRGHSCVRDATSEKVPMSFRLQYGESGGLCQEGGLGILLLLTFIAVQWAHFF